MAYGARLESGLGAIPQGFKSPILRQKSFAGSATTAGVHTRMCQLARPLTHTGRAALYQRFGPDTSRTAGRTSVR